MRSALTIAWATLIACNSSSPPPPPAPPASPDAELAAILEPIRVKANLPALAAGVWRNGVPVAIAATGLRRAGDPAHPVTANDQWHLGSDTKAMTATLIGIYVDRGVLHWTDTLAQLFPGDPVDPALASVTLDQLLQHRAGLSKTPPDDLHMMMWDPAVTTRADFVRSLIARAPAGTVGNYEYSNSSFMVAGAALERATGKRWEDLMQRELFTPLGMASCGFGAPGTTALVDQPWGHARDGTPMPPDGAASDNPEALGPAGTVHCALADWGKFLSLHAGVAQKLISSDALTHLHTPPPDGDYMGGWIIHKFLGHDGSNGMWYCSAFVNPANHLVIAWATNSAGAKQPPLSQDEIMKRIAVDLLKVHVGSGPGSATGSAQ